MACFLSMLPFSNCRRVQYHTLIFARRCHNYALMLVCVCVRAAIVYFELLWRIHVMPWHVFVSPFKVTQSKIMFEQAFRFSNTRSEAARACGKQIVICTIVENIWMWVPFASHKKMGLHFIQVDRFIRKSKKTLPFAKRFAKKINRFLRMRNLIV